MPLARLALMTVLIVIGGSAAWAEQLDKHACNLLKVELAGLLAVGVKDDMERGPNWAKDNLTKDKLTNIRRLIEVEEQLEFRCGLKRARVVAVSPAKGPPRKDIPETPERNPAKSITGKKADSVSSSITKSAKSPAGEQKPAGTKAAEAKTPAATKSGATKPGANPTPAAATAAAEPKVQPQPARQKPRREAKTYVSPHEVNPFSLSRYGSGR
jgi:hypothetical protein